MGAMRAAFAEIDELAGDTERGAAVSDDPQRPVVRGGSCS